MYVTQGYILKGIYTKQAIRLSINEVSVYMCLYISLYTFLSVYLK